MHQSSIHRPSHGHSGKALTRDLIFTKTRNDNLQAIKNLNLWGNDLEDLSLLNEMPNIEVISLSVNNIKTLKYFQNCFKLQELYLRKNDIKLLNEIQYLMNLPQLKVLWLGDNPCSNTKNYRQIVLRNLPYLIKLDNDVVSQTQKKTAQNNQNQDQAYEQSISKQRQGQHSNPSHLVSESNYQSVKQKNPVHLSELQQNKSEITQPSHAKNSSDRKILQDNFLRKGQSPLKASNNNKKAMEYEMEEILAYRDSLLGKKTPSGKSQLNQERISQQQHKYINQSQHSQRSIAYNARNSTGGKSTNNSGLIENRGSINQGNVVRRQSPQHEIKNPIKSIKVYQQPSAHNQSIKHQESSSRQRQEQRTKYPPQRIEHSAAKGPQYINHALNGVKKVSSPNIIMAIMSLLDDLDSDGLEIIKRQTQRKLIQLRQQSKRQLEKLFGSKHNNLNIS